MQIIGDNYTMEEIYPAIFKYTCEDGYHFESCMTNYGKVIYGNDILSNKYIIVKDNG